MRFKIGRAIGRKQGTPESGNGQTCVAASLASTALPPKRRLRRRIRFAVGAIATFCILSVAYAAFNALPGPVRVAPISITVHSSSSLPPEVQTLEAQTAPSLFDRDTSNGYVAYADESIDLGLDQAREIHAIKVYGPAPYLLTVQAQHGGGWTTIGGLDNIKLANLSAGWNTLQATQPITTATLRLVLTLANGNGGKGKNAANTSGAIPEIEIWAAGEHSLLSGNALVEAAVSAAKSPANDPATMPT